MNDPREAMVEQLFGTRSPNDRMRHEFLLIKALDDEASLRFSTQTEAWYVSASIVVSDGELSKGVTEHQATPWEAIQAFLHRLQEVDGVGQRIVTEKYGQRREWSWNGAAWRELAPR